MFSKKTIILLISVCFINASFSQLLSESTGLENKRLLESKDGSQLTKTYDPNRLPIGYMMTAKMTDKQIHFLSENSQNIELPFTIKCEIGYNKEDGFYCNITIEF